MKHTLTDDLTVVDFGAHFYPRSVEAPGATVDLDSEDDHAGVDRKSDPETVVSEMAAGGYDAMVFSNTEFMGHDDADETAVANDALLDVVDAHDEFYGLAAVPTGAGGEAAAVEFERCLDRGFNGGGLHETTVSLVDQEMEPVLEVADRAEAPLFVHIPKLPGVEYRLNATYGRELAQQESVTRTVHDGVFDRYGRLPVVWHHLGGNIASMLGRTHLHADPGRWSNQEPMKPYGEFKAQLEERVYVDTAEFFGYSAPIRIALEEFPASNLLFGTDFPWEPRSGEELGRFVDSILASTTRGEARQILGENALSLLSNA